MNETIELIQRRHSVRSYAERPITRESVELICDCAMRAPTAGNMQLYSILEIEDPALKDALAESCDHQPFIATAPLVLLFVADYQRWFDYFIACGVPELCRERGEEMRVPGEGDLLLAVCDTLIAAHTAAIAAESLGIGSCYIGDIMEQYEYHRELLNLPQYVVPVAMLCFGYEKERSEPIRRTPRLPRDVVCHRDAYARCTPDMLADIFAPHTPRRLPDGLANLGQLYYERKFSADFSREMTRSMRAVIDSWKAEPSLEDGS